MPKTVLIFFCLSVLQPFGNLRAQSGADSFLSADSLAQNETIRLTENWKYHAGDNPEWAAANFDDSAWQTTDPWLPRQRLPISGWNGIGWFRLTVKVDSVLWDKPLGLGLWQAGASEVFLDGKSIHQFGDADLLSFERKTAKEGLPKTVSFGPGARHVIAVRHVNRSPETFHKVGLGAGFRLSLGKMDSMVESAVTTVRLDSSVQMFVCGLVLAFGLFHLVLFAFFPSAKGNLYYAIFLFTYASHVFFDYQNFLAVNAKQSLFNLRMHRTLVPISTIFGLRAIYAVFAKRIPRQFWILTVAMIAAGVLAVMNPIGNYNYVVILTIPIFAEFARLVAKAIIAKVDGAWIFGLGLIVLILFASYDALLDLGLLAPIQGIQNLHFIGAFGMFIAMSVYLARDFAKTNERLLEGERRAQKEEMERKLLEADNRRKTRELEGARQLQLSMLPQNIPAVASLEIAAEMRTATEVGGDYYDFHVAEDGALTTAIGDATGHGARAGTMVTSIKTLFNSLTTNSNLTDFFQECTRTIKKMNLGNLYMAMTLARFEGHRMLAAAAGMPPTLIYRNSTKSLEEIELKGMPLGAKRDFPYQQTEVVLESGDTILLTTDGFEELFNDKNELFDYARVKASFAEVATKSPTEIIRHLFNTATAWRNGSPQNDDITFVVLKVK